MLIIKPIQEKEEQEKFCSECGVPFVKDSLAYSAFVDEKLVGICQFHFASDGAHLLTLRPASGTEDWDALFIMGRQTMNYVDLHGVHILHYDDDLPEGIPADFRQRLGFSEQNGQFTADLEGFFDNPCEHGKAGSAK